jgi:hypothetical protein
VSGGRERSNLNLLGKCGRGYTATLVAATLAVSRSSLYYRKHPHGSRADRTYNEQIVVACGEKPAY